MPVLLNTEKAWGIRRSDKTGMARKAKRPDLGSGPFNVLPLEPISKV